MIFECSDLHILYLSKKDGQVRCVKKPRNVYSFWEGPEQKFIRMLQGLMFLHQNTGEEGYHFHLLNYKNMDEFKVYKNPSFGELKLGNQADLIRTQLLYSYGGLWLDADTIVLGTLDPLFEKLEDEYKVVLAYENFARLSNGVAGSQQYFDYMRVYRDAQETILEYRGKKIEWVEVGNMLITEIYDSYPSFQPYFYFLYGQDSVYTLYYQNIVKVLFDESPEHFRDYIRKGQTLQVLIHNAYSKANRMSDEELLGAQNILNSYLNYSLDNLAQSYSERVTLRDLLEKDFSSIECVTQQVPREDSLVPPK